MRIKIEYVGREYFIEINNIEGTDSYLEAEITGYIFKAMNAYHINKNEPYVTIANLKSILCQLYNRHPESKELINEALNL